MQGYWKNNVQGWDRKGNKRKKQNRNTFLKDKGRALLKTYSYKERKVNEEKYRNETVMVYTYTGSRYGGDRPLPKTAGVYKVRVYFPKEGVDTYRWNWYETEDTEVVSIKAYKKGITAYNEHWYEAETHKPIREFLELTYRQYWKIEVFEVHKLGEIELDWTKELERRNKVHTSEIEEGTDYIYGKPVPAWQKWTWYNDGKRRKVCQGLANSADRAAVRTYIENEDWDAEIRTHACSKSIGWCVH